MCVCVWRISATFKTDEMYLRIRERSQIYENETKISNDYLTTFSHCNVVLKALVTHDIFRQNIAIKRYSDSFEPLVSSGNQGKL